MTLMSNASPWLLTGAVLAPGLLILSGWGLVVRRRRRFKRLFQILWDRKLRPHCPLCRHPLSDWQVREGLKFERQGDQMERIPIRFGAFFCATCAKPVRLIDEDGFEMTYEQALERLREPAVHS
ncbi:hypothetical protein [Geoalkalibacter sp.]|uniref:hypothetical protein n=1 Tax=Geoalkalibacter sp. TaxID=3041440 RepID=UPI00272E1870|nr:hypothetical protein [Geoalkalibacter sp.]